MEAAGTIKKIFVDGQNRAEEKVVESLILQGKAGKKNEIGSDGICDWRTCEYGKTY